MLLTPCHHCTIASEYKYIIYIYNKHSKFQVCNFLFFLIKNCSLKALNLHEITKINTSPTKKQKYIEALFEMQIYFIYFDIPNSTEQISYQFLNKMQGFPS